MVRLLPSAGNAIMIFLIEEWLTLIFLAVLVTSALWTIYHVLLAAFIMGRAAIQIFAQPQREKTGKPRSDIKAGNAMQHKRRVSAKGLESPPAA